MCLYTKWRLPREAKEDIHCFKVLKRNKNSNILWAPVQKKMYRQEKEYKTIIVRHGEHVNQGFHACITIERAMNLGAIYASRKTLKKYDMLILDAIIPAGSLYYIGDNDEIASNRIIIKDIKKQLHLCNMFF